MRQRTRTLSDQQKRQAARRIAAAAERINGAKALGPKATVDEVRRCLLSAVKVNPNHQPAIDAYADAALNTIRELYNPGSGS